MDRELYPEFPVLMVDDEKNFLNSAYFELRAHGISNVECCQNSSEVMLLLKQKNYSVILLDLLMPAIGGEELLSEITDKYPEIPVIIVSALPETETIDATYYMKKGAFDYLTKPIETKDLISTIQDALGLMDVYKEIVHLKKEIFSGDTKRIRNFSNIISQSETMQAIFKTIGLIAITSKPVLIRGEPGVGKEFVAYEIHKQSHRKGKFVEFNPVGLSDDLFSEILFGQKKDSPSDATQENRGMIERASGGTLFLPEIADMPMESQVKLLRLIQERQYYPLGSKEPVPSDARIVVSTGKDLEMSTKLDTFRQDLYYKLKAHDIFIPPLRARKDDIPLLLDHFVKKSAKEKGMKVPKIQEELYSSLKNYDFPGNISELKSIAYEAVAKLKSEDLPLFVLINQPKSNNNVKGPPPHYLRPGDTTSAYSKVIFRGKIPDFSEMEALYLEEVMRQANGSHSKAASLAGLGKKAFSNRLKKIKRKQKKKGK